MTLLHKAGCHPFDILRAGSERNERSDGPPGKILRFAQNDKGQGRYYGGGGAGVSAGSGGLVGVGGLVGLGAVAGLGAEVGAGL